MKRLFANRSADSEVFYDGKRILRLKDFVHAVYHAARRLPKNAYVLNDCSDRFYFAVVLFASALNRTVNLLPGNRTPDNFRQLAKRYSGAVVCSDRDNVPATDKILPVADLLPDSSHTPVEMELSVIDPERCIAIGFTSGSTGEPRPHPRNWRWALEEAVVAGRALDLEDADCTVVGTTPPQHMYGFVATIFMPLYYGLAIYRRQPFFAEEIREALIASSAPSLLVSTPAQIRACVLEAAGLRPPRAILSSAAPLNRDLAESAEQLFNTQVYEFYGSTETGAIASRRTVKHAEWIAFDGISISSSERGMLQARTDYLPEMIELTDRVTLSSPGHFILLGRGADLVKIAGKRTSLAELNHHLLAIPGVRDGSFVMPEPVNGREVRLAAVVEAPDLESSDILERLKQKLDPVFLPRPLRLVSHLPRARSGKLPRKLLLELLSPRKK